MSLRDKVLVLMTSLTTMTLALYLYVAVQIFRNDKLAEVSYSSAAVARNLAIQARIELDGVVNSLKPVVQGFDFAANKLAPTSLTLLQSLNKIQHLTLYRPNAQGQYDKVVEFPEDQPNPLPDGTVNLEQVVSNGTWIDVAPGTGKAHVILAARFGVATSPTHLIAVAYMGNANFVEAVQAPSNYSNVVIGVGGKLLFANAMVEAKKLPPFSEWKFVTDLFANNPPPGSAEVNPTGKESLFLAYANVGLGKTYVLSYIDKNDALLGVKLLITKSILMFIALLCFTIITAVLASRKITSALRGLTAASKEIATGKFDVRIEVQSHDEIGSLAQSFNSMAQQLSWYITQVAEKAAFESELNTARTVQDTLFPPNNTQLQHLDISGRYQPASQCGGDWWHYSTVGDKTFMWIGDATGHGVSAALLTSAARSAASIIEMFPEIMPGQALQMMNRAIHETSKGKLLMTFFIAAYDIANHELVYANASHEPPWLFHVPEGSISKKDIIPLNEANNPRLGESPDTTYEEGRIAISPGDRVFFYTDGVSELKDPKGQMWGERKFMTSIIKSFNEGDDMKKVAEKIQKEIDRFRSGAKLEDDVTFFVCKVKDAA